MIKIQALLLTLIFCTTQNYNFNAFEYFNQKKENIIEKFLKNFLIAKAEEKSEKIEVKQEIEFHNIPYTKEYEQNFIQFNIAETNKKIETELKKISYDEQQKVCNTLISFTDRPIGIFNISKELKIEFQEILKLIRAFKEKGELEKAEKIEHILYSDKPDLFTIIRVANYRGHRNVLNNYSMYKLQKSCINLHELVKIASAAIK